MGLAFCFRTRRRSPRQLVAAVVLLVALAAAETMSVTHALDVDAHHGGEPCKICISTAVLGGAAPAKAPLLEAPHMDVPGRSAPVLLVDLSRADLPSARGPPLVS